MGPIERREFLRYAGSIASLGVGAPLALNLATMGAASAQTVGGDYKALVCVFMTGGNDAYNTVLATDSPSWSVYNAVRDQAPSSIALLAPGVAPDTASPYGDTLAGLGGVLPIAPQNGQGRTFALHPLLTGLRDLFASRNLAIVANAGPLIAPTTKAEYANSGFAKPPKLFSHSDQLAFWQSMSPEGATSGWGGRMADLLMNQNSGLPTFTAISPTGRAVWLSGRQVRQYDVSTAGPIPLGRTSGSLFGNAALYNAAAGVMGHKDGSHPMQDDIADIFLRSRDAYASMAGALPGMASASIGGGTAQDTDALLQYRNPHTRQMMVNPLAKQLQIVGRIIQAQGSLGIRRQIFYVNMGSFDTHADQNKGHSALMAQLDQGLSYFWSLLGAIGKQGAVTTFTASDFGRTFTSNGDGTDHGWGGHHFVLGGAVRGGDIYGNFPVYSAPVSGNFSSPDQLTGAGGSLLPQISVDQYASTLGQWMGVSSSALGDVLPNIGRFSRNNLGFMAA